MAENSKTPVALPPTIIGGFTASTMALCNFHFVKIKKALYKGFPLKV